MRKTFLPWLACAAIAAVGVPTLAWGQNEGRGAATAPLDAGFIVGDNFFQDAAGGVDDTEVTINPGETVTFKFTGAGSTPHNVWFGEPGEQPQPSECNQTVKSTSARRPRARRRTATSPMPQTSRGPRAGRATASSTRPASTPFLCQAHGGMEGNVSSPALRR